MMSESARHDRLYAIFGEACELPADERLAYLDHACGDDDQLRREVEELLTIDEQEDSDAWQLSDRDRLGLSAAGSAARYSTAAAPMPEYVGPYRVIEVIGEGGMGVVYRAEQENPRRDVALKVIRPGVASPRMLKRFELEAQTLGRLHHHGIAQIYEAGTFDSGAGPQPFFAMEYLEGKPLLDYVADHALGVRERLELLIRICDAVEHAHSKCVIHRDLKPVNIIVTGGEPDRTPSTSDTLDLLGQPKILDFGVARVVDSDIQTTTVGTDIGQLVGTLPYMSPEQVDGQPDDLDTRSDCYALGVIGYELLANRRPHDLTGKSLPEAVRIIREDNPTPIGSIDRAYRGELETIIGKAMEKDKHRRYQSPRELAEDLRRYLRNEPIAARPPSAFYHVRKFAQRNRAMVTGLSIALIALLIGGVVAVWAQAERRAFLETAEMYKAQLKRTLEPQRGHDPLKPQEVDREWLRDASGFVDRRLRRQPREAAELRNLIGLNYLNLDEYNLAHHQLASALEARRALFRPPHADLAESLHNMGRVLWHQDEFDEAEGRYREALEMFIALYGPEHRQIAETISHIATCLRDRGECDDAETLYRRSLDMLYRMFGDEHEDIAANYNNMAVCLLMAGRYEEAAVKFDRALDMIRRVSDDPDDLRIARGKRRLGSALTKLREFERAQAMLDEALEIYTRTLGRSNRYVASILFETASLHHASGDSAQAITIAGKALYIQQRVLGDQLDTAHTLELLGTIRFEHGEAHEAVGLLWESLMIRKIRRRDDHADVLRTRDLLYEAAMAVDDPELVAAMLRRPEANSREDVAHHATEEREWLLDQLDRARSEADAVQR